MVTVHWPRTARGRRPRKQPGTAARPGRRWGAGRAVASIAVLALAVSGAAAATGSQTVQAATPASATMGGIVPEPALVQPDTAVSYAITSATAVHTDAASDAAGQIGDYLAGILRPSTGYPLPVTSVSTAPGDGITLLLSGADSSVGAQGYQLDVTAAGVVIRAQQPAGLFAGVQTLRQILPPQIESATAGSGPWTVPGGHIVDHPRFAYRGAMLDVARHFAGVATVERYIDQLALYKIDYLHLHLTDDQGWRLAINGWPDLTAIGGATGVGGGPGGYYTQADYRAIVAYAAARYITIVPEVDMPGHTGAAQSSYPSLNCDGKASPVSTSTAVGASSLCMTDLPTAEAFIDDVIGQVAALTPGPYINIGGDEAHSTSASDYATFMTWAQQDVVEHGKTAIGWNQIVGSTLQPSTVAVDWDTSGSDPALAAAAANGTGVIMAPANHAYMDQKYNGSTVIGLDWAADTDVQSAYGWDPGAFLSGAPASSVRGIEAPLWSETVTTPQDIDYLSFPRLPAYAELGWSPQSTHDFTGFAQRLAAQGPRWDVMGLRFYHSSQITWPEGAAGTGPTGPVGSAISGKCVDVTGGASADGTPVDLYDCNGTAAQQWAIGDDGTLHALGKCLDVASGGTADGSTVQLYTCNGTAAQQWRWSDSNGASLVNPQSGKCLDDPDSSAANGTRLEIWTCHDPGSNQIWRLP